MRSGRLRHRLVFQSKSYAKDAHGADIVSWSPVATVWGAIEPLSAKELFAQNQIQPEAQIRIVTRYNSNLVDESYRITNDGRYFDIVSIINESDRHRTLTFLCRSGVSEDVGTEPFGLLLESGDYLLLESGDKLLLEA